MTMCELRNNRLVHRARDRAAIRQTLFCQNFRTQSRSQSAFFRFYL